nr:ribonuclease H-like domain-containing protein [Tanacetum cinerariifolium]
MTGDDNHNGDHPKTSNPSQIIPPPTSQQIPYTVSSIKLPILKKREYDIWAMKMEHYLCHIDYLIWQVIQNGNGPISVITDTNGMIEVLPPKTIEEMWEAIKYIFGGNDESKKMQKYLLKQQFEGFYVSSLKSLHKGYDRFQTLLSQLEIHGVGVSHEDANQKFLRSLPSSWSQVALIMRSKPGTNDVSTAYSVSSPSVSKSQKEGSASYTDEVIHSFFANQSSVPQLDCDDLKPKWNALISIKWGILLETAELNGIKTVEEEMVEVVDSSVHVEEDTQNFAMMAYSFSNSGSNNETSADESDSKHVEYASSDSDSSVEPSTSAPEPVFNRLKVVSEPQDLYEPKVWTDAPIIEEYESDSDDDLVFNVQEDKEKLSFAFTDSVKHVKSPRENDKETGTPNHYPKIEKCSRHMIGNKAHLVDYQEFKGGSVAFGGSNGKITSKGKIKASMLDFENVYYVEELKHYNLFSVSQMCDKKNKVLFTNTDCRVMSPDFKLLDENQLLLKIPRQDNMYSFNLKNIDPSGDLSCLLAKASVNESDKWHRRLGHVNFENLNKLVKGNLVRGPKEANHSAGTEANDDQDTNSEEIDLYDEHFVLLVWFAYSTFVKSSRTKIQKTTDCKTSEKPVSQVEQIFQEELEKLKRQEKEANDAVRKEATHETQDDKEESFKRERMIADMDEDVEDIDEEKPAKVEEVLEVVTAAMLMIKDEAFVRQLEAELNAKLTGMMS